MTHVFETERLFGREYELADAEAAFEIYRDPVVMECRALASRAFQWPSIDILNIVIHPGNERSIAVAKRLGATFRGRTTQYYGQELELFQLARIA